MDNQKESSKRIRDLNIMEVGAEYRLMVISLS